MAGLQAVGADPAQYKKQAAGLAATLTRFEGETAQAETGFKAEQQQRFEQFIQQYDDYTAGFYSNVNALGKGLTDHGATVEERNAMIFQTGLQYGLQGVPAGQIRAAVSQIASKLLAPENERALAHQSAQAKELLSVPTKDEVLAGYREAEQTIKAQLEAQGAPKKKLDEILAQMGFKVPDEKEIEQGLKEREAEVATLKARVDAQEEALNTAGIPEEKKLGSLLLNGYRAGVEEAANQAHAACQTGACGGNCGGGCGSSCSGACGGH